MGNDRQEHSSTYFVQDRSNNEQELLHFWAFGDLHYRAIPPWHAMHSQRLALMFDDLHALWQMEGKPDFCVSPGDIVETCAIENYRVARQSLEAQLGDIPFYPGIGNHEYYELDGEDPALMGKIFTTFWQKPLCYTWEAGDVVCIMLDYPDPTTLEEQLRVYLSNTTLAFLDAELTRHADQLAIIFSHCPLYGTVGDRDPERIIDYNSFQIFFSLENSQQVRDILARHSNASLFISGHTHSGWEAPGLVLTEQLGNHPVTFINLMSPWYTGMNTGPDLSTDLTTISYVADNPDVIPTFSIRLTPQQATIRVRDHRTQSWLKQWIVPCRTKQQ
jgi:3',5'-cyclic AMP phosphodiesterase CpdA